MTSFGSQVVVANTRKSYVFALFALFGYRLNVVDAHCCHMGTAIKHPVPDRVKLSFVIFNIRRSMLSARCPDVKNYK